MKASAILLRRPGHMASRRTDFREDVVWIVVCVKGHSGFPEVRSLSLRVVEVVLDAPDALAFETI